MLLTDNDLARFWSKVSKTVDCWLWEAGTSTFGHGRFRLRGKLQLPHRISYELLVGPIPDGLWVLHKCDVPACVNPEHLFLGTRTDNMRDAAAKGRLVHKTHPELVVRGEGVNSSKLKAAEVTAIRERFASGGVTQKSLASEYGVGESAIWKIINRHTWEHLP